MPGLQYANVKTGIGVGAGAGEAITIAPGKSTDSLAVADSLIAVYSIHLTTGAWTNHTDTTTVTAVNTISIVAATTGEGIFMLWNDLND